MVSARETRRGARGVLAMLVLLLSQVGCGGSSSASRGPAPPYDVTDPGLPARLDDALRAWAEDLRLVGAAAHVETPGWFEWSGATGSDDLRGEVPFRSDDVARVGSATKPFTATLVLQLVDEGRLSLDARLAEFLPDYPDAEAITIEMLLRHRSGMNELQVLDAFFLLSVVANPERWLAPEEVLAWTTAPFPMLSIETGELSPRGPVGPPGGQFRYSQPGYIALGIVIEQVTGRELADLYEERVIDPLGLSATHLPRPGGPFDPVGFTLLYGLLPLPLPASALASSPDGLASASWSAGGLVSSARDLSTFLDAYLGARLFSRPLLERATTFLSTEYAQYPDEGYGYALYRYDYPGGPGLGHGGTVPSGSSEMSYLPDLDVYIGAVANTDRDNAGDPPQLNDRVRAALLGEPQP